MPNQPALDPWRRWQVGIPRDVELPKEDDLLALSEQCVEAAMQLVRAQIPHMVETYIIKYGEDRIWAKDILRDFGSWCANPDEGDAT